MSDKELPLKGYWIGTADVTDPNAYKDYVAANAVAFEKYGAKFLVRGGRTETLEGRFRARTVVLEFKDYETALACYHSSEYTAARALRDKASLGDLIVAEGYGG